MPAPSLLEFSATLRLSVQQLGFSRAPAHHIRAQRREPWVWTHWGPFKCKISARILRLKGTIVQLSLPALEEAVK